MSILSTRKIETEKAGDVERRIADGQGLYLRIVPNGTKSFTFRYSYAGKRQSMTLGTFPELSLARAREKAAACRGLLEEGKNPGVQAAVERQVKLDAITVRELIDQFYENWLKAHYKDPDQAKHMLLADTGSMSNILVPDVQPVHITACVNKLVARGAKVGANRLLTGLRKMFQYAVDQHMIQVSPVVLKKSAAGGREHSRKVHLRFEQLADLLKLLRSPPMNSTRAMSWQTSCALQLLILTGQRPGEIARMQWNEVDLEHGIWTIPAEFTKVPANGDHTIHLSKQALDLLKVIKAKTDASKVHVFPSPQEKYKDQPIRRHSLSETMLSLQRAKIIKFSFCPHDLRRTFSSRMNELKQPPHVIEKILNHKMAGVMAIYNQYEYFPERREALQLWGDQVESLGTKSLSTH